MVAAKSKKVSEVNAQGLRHSDYAHGLEDLAGKE
jgi:hypothetical protein